MNATQHSITYNGETLTFICEEITKQYSSNAWRWAYAKFERGNDVVYLGMENTEANLSSAVRDINLYVLNGKGMIRIFGAGATTGNNYSAYVNKQNPGAGDTVIYGFGNTGFEDYGSGSPDYRYCLNDIIADGWTFTIDPRVRMRFWDSSNNVVAYVQNHVLTVYGGADLDPHTDPYYHDDYIEQKLLTIENMKQALIDYDTNLMGVIDAKIDEALGAILNASY